MSGHRAFSGQPFADHDILYFNQRVSTVGLVKRNENVGAVRVTEIAPGRDTVLDVQVPVSPVSLLPEVAEAAIDARLRDVRTMASRSGNALSESAMRRIVEEALHIPDHLPLTTSIVTTGSDEIWLRSSEKVDSLVVWLVVDRVDPEAPPRRVLLPDAFRLGDATRTHVWGRRVDGRGSGQVQGRELVAN